MERLQRSVYIVLLLVLVFAGLRLAASFFIPLALAAVCSMLFISLSNFFEGKGIPRSIAALLCILIFVSAIGLIAGLLYWQMDTFTENLDAMKARLQAMLGDFRAWINDKAGIDKNQQKEMVKGQGGQTGTVIAGFAAGLIGIVINTILVLVYMYLCLYYRSHFKRFILRLVPSEDKKMASLLVDQSGRVAQKYLSGLGAMIGVLWIMYGIGFSIAGVQSALFFAVLCGVLEIVPFVGNLTGISLAILSVIAQGGESKIIIGVLIVYGLVQFIQTYLLEPLIVGEQVNINPFFTIMAIVLGELLWGVAGMVLAIPLLGILKIICDRIEPLKPYGFLIGPANAPGKRKFLFRSGKT